MKYRDDGLAAVSVSGSQADKKRKVLTELFKEDGLSITVECNIKKTDFLDVILDLENRSYRPFRKPNDRPLYINVNSNHPPNIIKQLPKMIEQRLTYLSSSREIFDSAVQPYEVALRKSGYDTKLSYNPKEPKVHKHRRKRNILWYNPPYNLAVKTNLGKMFLRLVDKHFNRRNNPILSKLFNRNTIKVSYCVSKNMKSKLDKHNKLVLQPKTENPEQELCGCDIEDRPECPLQGNCLVESIVYKAEVTAPGTTKKCYYGLTEKTFRTRFSQHKSNFKLEKYRNATELSKYVWQLKDKNIKYDISWSVSAKAYTYRGGSTHCDLCLTEKTIIAYANPTTTLNSRTEILGKCRHRLKFTLKKV